MPQLSQKQAIILIAAAVTVVVIIVLVVLNLRSASAPPQVTLMVWGAEPRDAVEKLLSSYKAIRPNVTITYAELAPATYSQRVVDALAAGEGPDVFLWPNREVLANRNKFAPVRPEQMGLAQFREFFPTVAEQELATEGQIYGSPAYLDTLALFYNSDYFDEAALVGPPRTWEEFRNFVPYLRIVNDQGQLVRAAAAIGGSEKSVVNATDLLALLFEQNGVTPTQNRFDLAKEKGLEAFNFYLQFANTASPAYTWTDSEIPSLDHFANGDTAMAFGYASDRDRIRAKSPLLRFDSAAVPQISPQAARAIARYDAWVVSRQSSDAAWGWDFVIYASTRPQVSQEYLTRAKRPPALKSQIGQLVNDPEWGPFARQALTARAWYYAGDRPIRDALNSAIQGALRGTDPNRALQEAEAKLNEILRKNGT